MDVKRSSKRWCALVMISILLLTFAAYAPSYSAVEQSAVDLDGDGNVTSNDVMMVLDAMMADQYDPKADINKDGKVDQEDLSILMGIYEKSTGQKASLN